MAGTRSSARQAAKAGSSPASSPSNADSATGSKRKAESTASPAAKKGKKGSGKEQITLEASLATEKQPEANGTESQDKAGGEAAAEGEIKERPEEGTQHGKSLTKEENSSVNASATTEDKAGLADQTAQAKPQPDVATAMNEEAESKVEPKVQDEKVDKPTESGSAVEVSKEREEAAPSSILEKGIIYFFFRGRVGIEEPSSVTEIARSYIVLRPLPLGAKLGDGPIGDEKNNRILALPKKVLPKSPKDKFMTFVEKANIPMDEIKETLSSSDYTTQTAGARHSPAAAPVGEGVYAITQTGRDTHLAYILTLPAELNDVQKDIGLQERGSFFTSAKNPEASGPANASLPQKAQFPKEILDEFGGRGWMPLQPNMLNYNNAQFLLIGHSNEGLEKAAQPQHGEDKKSDKETPLEEVEKLEHEDELRVKHLSGDDSVFTDLDMSSADYPKLQTTW